MKKNHPEQLPLARTEQLIVKEVDDEVLVYDLKTNQAHCLNKTAGFVWKNCDGKNSVTEINAALIKETAIAFEEGVVWLALDQLEKFKLLRDVPTHEARLRGLNRRQLIRTLGVAAAALPVIITMASPNAQAQSSCRASGFGPCISTTNCCKGVGKCQGSNPSVCQ